ncbi:hypothetical protein MMC28_006855 [Mycoblastus sanguinarius]|nr:hypothetical protein [Mycoblastus sanguinarius]
MEAVRHVLPRQWVSTNLVLLVVTVLLVYIPLSEPAPTTSPSTQNITITVPQGTQSHGDPHLLCTPSRWTDVATFFLANFVSHAATVKSLPGEPALSQFWTLIFALVFPASGVVRGLSAIYQRAVFADTPLQTAARAQALCVVVRTPWWKPQTGDVVEVRDYRMPDGKDEYTRKAVQKRIRTPPSPLTIRLQDHFRGWGSNLVTCALEMLDRVWYKFNPKMRAKMQDRSHVPDDQASLVFRRNRGSHSFFQPSTTIIDSQGRKVHGVCHLPWGYALSMLSSSAYVIGLDQEKETSYQASQKISWHQNIKTVFQKEIRSTSTSRYLPEIGPRPSSELSSNYNLPKALIAIFQTLYASATLYRTRGDQIQRYGYAAFGLTVAPYLVMSILNLASTMLTPDYTAVYLVRSKVMEEALRRPDAGFEGIVGTLRETPSSNPH